MSYYGPDQPRNPWEGADPPGGYDGYGQPEVYGSAEGQAPWAQEPRRGSKALVAVLATVLVILLCGGGVGVLYLIGSQSGTPRAGGSTPTAGHTSEAASAAPGTASYDPTSIQPNQCVVNDGTEADPRLRVVSCGPNTFLVLARFDGTTDIDKCKAVTGATHNYKYDTTPDSDDFVLCLKQQ